MSHKEKATELIVKFMQIETNNSIDHDTAVKCALITVQEIMELTTWIDESFVRDYPLVYSQEDTYEFWNEVYKELKKL